MNKQNSKKLNSKQKTIAVIALIVTVFLAICITFAWYTNRINVMGGKFSLGSYDYTVSLFDVSGTTATQLKSEHYSQEDEDTWELGSGELNVGSMASNSVKYQVIKVKNNSGFDIKAYEYLTYNTMTAEQTAIANYFYFKPFALNISGDVGASEISTYLSSYTFPTASDIASPSGEVTFGTIKNNAVALEQGEVTNNEVSYYLIAYCVTGLPEELVRPPYQGKTVNFSPVITIGQANGPIPQTTASAKVLYADSWQALRSAIASANSGDTIYLTKNIESPVGTNLSMTNGVNLNLNSYNLIIHGDLVFNYKTAEERRLTVPVSSQLYIDGNLYVTNIGPFSINSTNSARNVFIGKVENGEVTGGNVYVNCGLSVTDTTSSISGTVDDETYLSYIYAEENSGLMLSNVQLRKADAQNGYAAADITVTDSNTMVKIGAGSSVNSIVLPVGKGINDVYIVNYGIIDSIDLSNMDYTGKSKKVSAYIKNFNTVNSLSLKTGASGAKGIKTAGQADFNTRVINGDGASTTFSGDYNTSYFTAADIEPFGQTTDESLVIENDRLTGDYTVYLKNVNANSGANAESITGLFAYYGFTPANCAKLKIVTSNSIKLKPAQFENIRDNFSGLLELDLSSAAMANATIPNNAMNATLGTAAITNLRKVTLPYTSVQIGSNAFKGTRINEVTIGSNVTGIGTDAFNVDNSVKLEVIWDGADSIPGTYLSGFDVNKTTIFMEESLAELAITNNDYTEAWKLNMYEFYDFKTENNTYYCKYSRDGTTTSGCEIIYYAGAIADKAGDNLVPASLNDGTSNYSVVTIKRQAFKKAIIADGGGTTNRVILDLSNCSLVDESAFEGTSNAPLRISTLTLGMVHSIGKSAFKYNDIAYSAPRPSRFSGMSALGSYAFQNAKISGGILDLHGSNERYSASDSALISFEMNGAYAGNTDTGNAVLDLRNIATIGSNFANGAVLKCDVLLQNVESIAANAFSNSIYGNNASQNVAATNIVDARNVRSIGGSAFYGIECAKLYLGTHSANLTADGYTAYKRIIGSTSGNHIGTLVLDGTFAVANEPALASSSPTDRLVIENLKIARVTDSSDNVVKTLIPAYAFATDRTLSGGQFTMQSPNLIINDVITGEVVSGDTVYASFDIGDYAFRGTGFNNSDPNHYYDFEGVVDIGEGAFESSTIDRLNLGNSIDTIASENFIWYCDTIQRLKIERSVPQSVVQSAEEGDLFTDYMVILTGAGVANEKFSSTGQKLASFKIEVDMNLVTTYINDTVWAGWKDYFQALIYESAPDANGNVWYYNIIDPNVPSKGAHIVGWKNIYGPDEWGYIWVDLPQRFTQGGQYYNITAFGTDEDMFKQATDDDEVEGVDISFDLCPTITTLNPKSLQSNKIAGLWDMEDSGWVFDEEETTTDHTLYKVGYNGKKELYKVFSSFEGSTFTVPADVYKIKSGAFSGTSDITAIELQSNSQLRFIESDAFENSSIKTFDFSNMPYSSTTPINMIFAEESVFGSAREQVLDPNTGHYWYKPNTDIKIILPDAVFSPEKNLIESDTTYSMYYDYGLLVKASVWAAAHGSSLSNKANTKTAQSSLKQNEADVVLSGITYHIMSGDVPYEGKTYSSSKTKFVAVVTGLNAQTAASSVVIIPSSISVKGINYEVVGITDNAFGKNDVLETLVLPNKNVSYSSDALAGCSKLGIIQYNDIVAFTESAKNNVAALPVQSTKSLLESSAEESED